MRRFTWLLAATLALTSSAIRAEDGPEEPTTCQGLWSWLSGTCEAKARQELANATDQVEAYLKKGQPTYGLQFDAPPKATDRATIFVHGLNSRPEDMAYLSKLATDDGRWCACLRYPNDQSIAQSAQLFRRELQVFCQQHPNVAIDIVSHSMGGLVARDVLEGDDPPSNIRKFIMLATPNHGSDLAKYTCSLDLYEFATSETRRNESGLIVGSLFDGLSEAIEDLRPNSEFLKRLNSRQRNPKIEYTIVLGTKAPVSNDRVLFVERQLKRAGSTFSWCEQAAQHVSLYSAECDEVVSGKGDGLVSIQSGQLDGVNNVLYGDFSHAEILGPHADDQITNLQRRILDMLR